MAADAVVGRKGCRLEPLRGREAFDRVYREGRRVGGPAATVVVRASSYPGVRVGIAVSRGAGGSVGRNRARRRVREAMRRLACRLRSGYDMVVVVRSEAAGWPYAVLVGALEKLVEQAGMLEAGEGPAAGGRS